MSKNKHIKLIGPVFHDDTEYAANSILSIPNDITEIDAERLIKLGAADYETVVFAGSHVEAPPLGTLLIDDMTKKQCQEELTAAGIEFDKKAKLDELQKLVSEHRKSLENNGDNADINKLTREELEAELTARAIEFNAEQTDAELRQLLIDNDDDGEFDINSLTREQLELELTARAIEFNAEQTDDELRQLLIDDESNGDGE